ncbi:WhiB family transcriptional regulator [Streptomyces noursei]|uniref:WhiB family transcriptional regulator n=1 Tax=Streptomyces noursei TaxID=1971 RepID=UPI0023B78BC9|nr:WhiB family transcriptional regulator [Streptomyces noursei]
MSRYDWMDQALCAQTDPEAFHPEGSGHNYEDARAVCDACPVQRQCGEHADRIEGNTSHRDRHGMWAGRAPRARVPRKAAASGGQATVARNSRNDLILRLASRGGMSTATIAAAAGCDERTVYRVTSGRSTHEAAA